MARSKYTDRFCGYCNRDTKMEIVGTMDGIQGKTWYRCTRCHHTSLLEDSQDNIKKLDPSTATPYTPWQSFQIGEAIFHQEWNDVGKVMSKMKTSDGSNAIIVSFERLGSRRLIENLKPESITEQLEHTI